MSDHSMIPIGRPWNPTRPHVLVVACSDGRLQQATDDFLGGHLGIVQYDRLYVPGGAGALSPSGRDFLRAQQLQQECRYLVDLHDVESIVALFHGAAADGPIDAMCADYRRKMSWGNIAQWRAQQEKDARELLENRWLWAAGASIAIYRCETSADGRLSFVALHIDPAAEDERPSMIARVAGPRRRTPSS